MLTSLGVGAAQAAAGAVAIQWVLKDGFGEVGKLIFTRVFAKSFDTRPKTWKFVGEMLANIGSFFMIMTAFAPAQYFLVLASVGNTARSISYLLWGATHAHFSKYFALAHNMGDVVAKSDSQLTVTHLLGLGTGVGLISFSSHPVFLLSVFAAIVPLHIVAALRGIHAVQFEVLNQSKAQLLMDEYLVHGTVPSPEKLRHRERFFGEWVDNKQQGSSSFFSWLRRVAGRKPQVTQVASEGGDVSGRLEVGVEICDAFRTYSQLTTTISVLGSENYLLGLSHDGTVHVVFHQDAEGSDILFALFHGTRVSHDVQRHPSLAADALLEKTLRDTLAWCKEYYSKFVADTEESGWHSDSVAWIDRGTRVTWPRPEQ